MNNKEITDILSGMYVSRFGREADVIAELPPSGSTRRYYKIGCKDADGMPVAVIGTYAPNKLEFESFIELDRIFIANNINVPEVLVTDTRHQCYLQQYVEGESLFGIIRQSDSCGSAVSDERERMLTPFVKKALEDLVDIQLCPGIRDKAECYNGVFGADLIKADLDYFKYCFLKPLGVEFDNRGLEQEFRMMTEELASCPEELKTFMYRDCQSRNIICGSDGSLCWIDFQGGMAGPAPYDAVSLLWQAKACFSMRFRNDMFRHYSSVFASKKCVPESLVMKWCGKLVPLRVFQTLGAYGFRGLVEKKSHFIESLSYGVSNLVQCRPLLEGYPELHGIVGKVSERMIELNPFQKFGSDCPDGEKTSAEVAVKEISVTDGEVAVVSDEPEKLTVRVESFSYREGYPVDFSGNGGGFVFDCRYMHNPGRYEEYKSLTGRDQPVIDFLEREGEIQPFVDGAMRMVSPAVEKYIKRGFTNLSVCFGCTGGRHRSVYSADHFARRIAALYPVRVEVYHRRQGIAYTIGDDRKEQVI